uniref:SAP domain-containing protein n=2 Tax=Clastoptera arizonana TaxID=38151 RepID=A0A1B6DP60_9HEMI
MAQFGGGGGGKNPPWVRSGQQTMGMSVSQQGHLQTEIMGQAMVLQYPQAQMFQQAQLGQISQIYPTTVTYPSRALNSAAFGTGTQQQNNSVSNSSQSSTNNSGSTPKQRVFTGTVTKIQDNFGFVDEDVFFQTSCCVKGSNPLVGDRVLVEAMFNDNMPFKWNATRIQVLPMGRNEQIPSGGGRFSVSYNQVPPPPESLYDNSSFGRRDRMQLKRSRRDDDELDRKKRREEQRRTESNRDRDDKGKETSKEKERVKSPPARKRSKSPRRPRRPRVVPRYMVQIPKIALDMPEADVLEIKRRYSNLYIPSDFFSSSFRWVDMFPPHRPLTLERPCAFHVMHKDVEPVIENTGPLEAPDADYLFCAKVMLLSMPDIDELFRKCCTLAEDRDKEGSNDDHGRDFVHPTRLINFLVGLRGKNETMAIGGPWSPSLDGPNPEKDPGVLIKTAIRNCKALTGIDLSNCTQWYRFLEIYYRRSESMHKGKPVAARIETVVLYLPDVWNCLPTRLEWDGLHLNYQKQLERKLTKGDAEEDVENDEKDGDTGDIVKKAPTDFSELDPKTMKVTELREELEARTLSPRGIKSQLAARLLKAIKSESDKAEEELAKKENAKALAKSEKDDKEDERKKKEEDEKKKLDERDRGLLEKRYSLPENTHLLVHPSRTAKSGKFDCTVMSLSLLLDYRQEDTKEHSFEVSLFAELFNEMLMRDFGFRIYKALTAAPEKQKEEKEDKDRKKDKDKKSDKEKKDDKKEDKKDDRKDDKKDDKKDKEKKSDEDDDLEGDDDFDEDDEEYKDKKDKGKKDGEKKKKDRIKLVTEDPYLLLAFVYFDQTHCGYIFDKDIEELLFTLGLNLSRAQVKKLVQKVVTRDSLHYRKLTDKPKDNSPSNDSSGKQNGEKSEDDLIKLGRGNKQFLPIFNSTAESSSKRTKTTEVDSSTSLASGFVMYNGSLLDVNKLMNQLKRSEDARIDTEKYLAKLKSENSHLKDQTHRSSNTIKDLTLELKDFKERLSNTNSELCSIDVKTKLYFSILQEIHDKVNPIVSCKTEKTDDDIETVEMDEVQILHTSSKSGSKKSDDTHTKKGKPSPSSEKKEESKQGRTTAKSSVIKEEENIKVSQIKAEENVNGQKNSGDIKEQA